MDLVGDLSLFILLFSHYFGGINGWNLKDWWIFWGGFVIRKAFHGGTLQGM
jgi:hypothetical protein